MTAAEAAIGTAPPAAPAATGEYAAGYTAGAAWWAVAMIMVFQIVSMIDRVSVAVLIPEIRADLGLNDFQISLVQGLAFALFYGFMGLIIGGLVDRWSPRRIMFGGIMIWSIAAGMTGLARTYIQFFLGRLMVGFGEGAISPAAQALISTIFPRHRLATPMSLFTAAGVAGVSISFALGGFLLARFTEAPLGGPLEGLAPWRQVLIVTGFPGVLVALLAFTIREPRRPRRTGATLQAASWSAFLGFLRAHPRMMGGMLGAYTFTAMATQGMMTWAPSYGRRVLGIGAAEVGAFMGLAVATGGIFGGIALGILVDRLFQRGMRDAALRCFALMGLVFAPLAAVAFVLDVPTLMFGAVMLTLLTLGACFGPALAAIHIVAPPAMRGRFGALAVLVSNLGGLALGPMLIGALTDYVFGDPDKVGLSIATALLILGPCGAAMILWARPAFLAHLDAQRAG